MSSLYEAVMLEDLYEEGLEIGLTHEQAIEFANDEYDRRSN